MSVIQTAIGGSLIAGALIAAIGAIAPEAPRRELVLEQLYYSGGIVTQQIAGDIEADWTANFSRPSAQGFIVLCAGKGDAPGIYRGEISPYSPSEWTGDICPEIQAGDVGEASWTYLNEHGLIVTLVGSFTVE